jgi:LacI family transcriptional regulator
MQASIARRDGYQSALDRAGIPVDENLIREGNFFVDSGYAAGMELLRLPRGERPTAFFAGSDVQAIGVMKAARELGLDVPGDVSIVGYDDVPEATWLSPALTTVSQKLPTLATMATDMLLDIVAGHEPLTNRVNVATELVIRDSTAPPPKNGHAR